MGTMQARPGDLESQKNFRGCPSYQMEKRERNTLAVSFLLLSYFPPELPLTEPSKSPA